VFQCPLPRIRIRIRIRFRIRIATLAASLAGVLAITPYASRAQRPDTTVIHVASQGQPVAGAHVESGTARALTDRDGTAWLVLAPGSRTLTITKLGFDPETLRVTVLVGRTEVSVALRKTSTELAPVVVAATRDERRITDEPTRVEVTDRDDIKEALAGSPGVIAELLTEAGGVRVQNTSAGIGGASVRIRGLRGRYTKLLSDGLPLFGVSAEALGPLQIPPIDLERVEVIKGVASALYGPAAMGGVVNLVSQRPNNERALLFNQTSRDATDAVLWDARELTARWGYTLVASAHRQRMQDVDGDGWANIPGFERAVLRPRMFWTGPGGSSWLATSGLTAENRTGGTVAGGMTPDGHPFEEGLHTWRADAGTVARFRLDSAWLLSVRGSVTGEWRTHAFGTVRERDSRNTMFGEVSLALTRGSHVLVAGAAVERDDYTARDVAQMSYDFLTPALFAEHTWSPASWFGLSSSARLDLHSEYGSFVSPRMSALFHSGGSWNARFSAGAGIFAPTPFTEETEAIGLSRVRPLSGLGVERSRGVSADVGGMLGPIEVNISAHSSTIDSPVAVRPVTGTPARLELVNAAGPTRTQGLELYARYRLELLTFTATYASLDGSELDVERGTRRDLPLNPRQLGGFTVVYEREDETRIGLESFFSGRQAIADDPYRTVTEPYMTIDALIQRRFGRVVVFLHGENLNDVRQTRFDPLLRPTPGAGGRWTTDVWAPLEGRVINAGVRVMRS
jgi:iron complex outermembrane receptor protein